MDATADVVVVGAGIIGCAIARELASRAARVTVLETSGVGAGATQASAGVLAPHIEAPEPGPLLELTTRSLGMYDEFVASLRDEGTAVEYARPGTLDVAFDATTATKLLAEQQRFPHDTEWLDPIVARELEPALPEAIEGGLLARAHGYVRVPQLLNALARSAASRRVAIRSGTRVRRVRRGAAGLLIDTDTDGTIGAGQVVVACGSWADQCDIQGDRAQGIRPVRGQLLELRWSGPPITRVLWSAECYVVPWRDGTILVGATMEDAGFDQRTTIAGIRDLMGAVCELLPAAWQASLIEARAGLRPASADGLPVVGPSTRVDGVTYAVGHFRNGILLAPLTAHVVAEWIAEGRRDPALALMRPDR